MQVADSRGTGFELLFLGAVRFLIRTEGTWGMATLLPVKAEMITEINPPIMTVNMVAMT
jgi:hypothetical protein